MTTLKITLVLLFSSGTTFFYHRYIWEQKLSGITRGLERGIINDGYFPPPAYSYFYFQLPCIEATPLFRSSRNAEMPLRGGVVGGRGGGVEESGGWGGGSPSCPSSPLFGVKEPDCPPSPWLGVRGPDCLHSPLLGVRGPETQPPPQNPKGPSGVPKHQRTLKGREGFQRTNAPRRVEKAPNAPPLPIPKDQEGILTETPPQLSSNEGCEGPNRNPQTSPNEGRGPAESASRKIVS